MEQYYKDPDEFWQLRQLYWHLRYRRAYDLAARRRYYRRIAFERSKLVDKGFAPEHVRLYCRYQANPKMKVSLDHLVAYERSAAELELVLNRIRGTNAALAPILP